MADDPSETFSGPTDKEIADALSACEEHIASTVSSNEATSEVSVPSIPKWEPTPTIAGNLSEALQAVPGDTQSLLDQLFRAEYKAVKPIIQEELIKL